MRLFGLLLTLVAVSGVVSVTYAEEFSSANFTVQNPTLLSGGFSSSTSFGLQSIISQIASGTSTSASFGGNAGFLFFPFASTPSLSATAGDAQVALSWTASNGFLGWTSSSYSVGQSTASGGPYSYASLGNVTSSTRTGLTNGTTYYFVVIAEDAFGNFIATSTQVSAAPAAAPAAPPASSGGGGGGGGGGGVLGTSATATFTGRASPGSIVTILKDAAVVATTKVGETATFSVAVGNLNGGTYLFSVYAEDSDGNQSSTITIPVSITSSVNSNVSGIFLAPTMDIDKTEVKQGNPIRVFGRSVPESTITISVNSDNELFFQTPSDKDGVYSYSFLTTPLELGAHSTRSNASKSGEVSRTSKTLAFTVGSKDVLKTKATTKCGVQGDVNCDVKINITDFSIEVFWYKKPNPPAKYDLNGDGKVNMVDLSIMASNWTG